MTTYSFKVTKGKYQLSLTTTDKDMIVEEFEKWVKKISAYVHKSSGHETAVHPVFHSGAEKELTEKKIEEQLKNAAKPEQKLAESKEEEQVKQLMRFIHSLSLKHPLFRKNQNRQSKLIMKMFRMCLMRF